MFEEHGGSFVLSLAAYNAGGSRVKQWMKAYGDPRRAQIDAIDWIELIPITETRQYVQHILENLQVYRARLGQHSTLLIDADLHGTAGRFGPSAQIRQFCRLGRTQSDNAREIPCQPRRKAS